MKKKTYVLITIMVATAILAGCTQPLNKSIQNGTQTTQNTVKEEVGTSLTIETQTSQTQGSLNRQDLGILTRDINFTEVQPLNVDKILEEKEKVLTSKYNNGSSSMINGKANPSYVPWSTIANNLKVFEFGDFVEGPYKGQKYVLLIFINNEMGTLKNYYRLAYDETTGALTLIKRSSSEEQIGEAEWLYPAFAAIDNNYQIKSLTPPDWIVFPYSSSKAKIIKTIAADNLLEKTELGNVVFTDQEAGEIYMHKDRGLVQIILSDKTIAHYSYDMEGLMDEKKQIFLTFDGEKIDINQTYEKPTYGCGMMYESYIVSDVQDSELKKIGTATNGITFYEPANPLSANGKIDTKTVSGNSLNNYYSSYVVTSEDKTLTPEVFVAEHPVLYFRDPLNHWVEIVKSKFKPLAECGKPVIYLYPEKTQDISVKVGIDKFTETIPAYNSGWNVKADPNGKLYNYADGKNYPYLYWEGTSEKTIPLTKGFVVSRQELPSFLNKSLDEMGLNSQEKADFIEFWQGRMLENNHPYFLISFIGTKEFSKIAPLDISPTPDTLIRVFMYYQPIEKKIYLNPQQLTSIPRRGFTVVEWGGTSSIPWKK